MAQAVFLAGEETPGEPSPGQMSDLTQVGGGFSKPQHLPLDNPRITWVPSKNVMR